MTAEKENVSNLSYDELFERYGRLIYKFTTYNIDGFTHDDIYQELCIVLVKCQKMFVPGLMKPGQTKPAKFSSYFVSALRWKMQHLMYRATKRMGVWQSMLDLGDEDEQARALESVIDPHAELDLNEMMFRLDLLQLPAKMQTRCEQIINMRRRRVVLRARDDELVRETKVALVGYNNS